MTVTDARLDPGAAPAGSGRSTWGSNRGHHASAARPNRPGPEELDPAGGGDSGNANRESHSF